MKLLINSHNMIETHSQSFEEDAIQEARGLISPVTKDFGYQNDVQTMDEVKASEFLEKFSFREDIEKINQFFTELHRGVKELGLLSTSFFIDESEILWQKLLAFAVKKPPTLELKNKTWKLTQDYIIRQSEQLLDLILQSFQLPALTEIKEQPELYKDLDEIVKEFLNYSASLKSLDALRQLAKFKLFEHKAA